MEVVMSRCQMCGKENPSKEHIKKELKGKLMDIETDTEYLREDIEVGDRKVTGELIKQIDGLENSLKEIYGR